MSKLHHVGIAVRSIDEASRLYTQALGVTLDKIEPVPSHGVSIGVLPAGDTEIELLEPLGDDSPIAAFLDKRGEGIHHLCIQVEDIYATMERLREEGFRVLNDEPQRGGGDYLVVFVHPRSANGVLLELSQRIPPSA